MRTMETVLRQEVKQLKELIRQAEKRLKKSPKGQLRAAHKKGILNCYYKKDNKAKWNYLKKSEHALAEELVQRDYDLQLLKLANKKVLAAERFLQEYKMSDVKGIYHKLSYGRKRLLKEYIIPDDVYAKQWLAHEYEGKTFTADEGEIMTERGECVRSKSEKIIADKLYSLGIPYRYECPLILDGDVTIYPDFTILRPSTREEIYLEHLGMMGDAMYVEKTMYKLATYEKNGIYLGVNLFVTFETAKRPLNTRALDDFLRRVFCEE